MSLWRNNKGLAALVVLTFLLITTTRILFSLKERREILNLYPPGSLIEGYAMVVDDPLELKRGYRLLVKFKIHKLLVTLFSPFQPDTPLRFGDKVWVKTHILPLNPCSDSLSTVDILSFRHLRGWCKRIRFIGSASPHSLLVKIHILKGQIKERMTAALDPEASSLLAALVLGAREELPKELKYDFKASGLAHLLAVSGFHVGIVALVIFWILRLLLKLTTLLWPNLVISPLLTPSNLGALTTIPLLSLYVEMTGGRASAIRAALMLSLYIVARVMGRERPLFTAVVSSFVVLVLFQPLFIFQPGFQLTYLAVGGIMVILHLYRPVEDRLQKGLSVPYRVKSIINGMGIWLAISLFLPLLLWPWVGMIFHRIPLLAPISNLLLTPLASLLIASGFLWVLCALTLPFEWLKPLGTPVVLLTKVFIRGISFAGKHGPFPWIPLSLSFLMLGFLIFASLWLLRKRRLALTSFACVIVMVMALKVIRTSGIQPLTKGNNPALLCSHQRETVLVMPPLSPFLVNRCVLPGLMRRDATRLSAVIVTSSSSRAVQCVKELGVLPVNRFLVPMSLYLSLKASKDQPKGVRPLLHEERVGCFNVRPLGKDGIGIETNRVE